MDKRLEQPNAGLKSKRRFIFISILALTLFGVLMIYESSSVYAFKVYGDPAYFLKRQILFFLFGLAAFFSTLFVEIDFLKRYNKEFLLFTILTLVVVAFFGQKGGGARRWFSLAGFNIQPSEILKVTFLLYCADYCQRKGNTLRNIKNGLIPLGVVLASVCILLILQPDLGTAAFWVIWAIFFLFICNANLRHLAIVIGIGLLTAFFLVKFSPYRARRMTSYFNPFADPQGAGFQLVQSQIAYGEGGLCGVGFGEGRQKLSFLPASHTDFVFSIIAEEFGLWGVLGIMMLFFILFHIMFFIARAQRDGFKSGVLWGIILIFFLEVAANIGVSCGLFPTKGLPLPFISYGGSNLVVHYILLGLFFNASRVDNCKVNHEDLIGL
ncbi:MAG: putative lipid II flippase FtsW [Candidatus Omnitrophica bacterium]|nr:putative lipid II flippase FtsW [Candidatus Omnitrophota bacterium]MDD5429383.1 putative lipid II flippase FtsW [Candidatus Omnitrophota bacterium]